MEQMNFNKQIMEQSVKFVEENMTVVEGLTEKVKDMPLDEAAQILLIDKYGIAQIEAAEIVADLKKGIADFEAQYKAAEKNEEVSVAEHLKSLTEGMEEQEQINCYANILTAMQLLGKENVTQEEIEAMFAENAGKEAGVLVAEIEYRFGEDIPFEAIARLTAEKLDADILSKLAQHIALNKESVRLMTALCLYMAQREGKIKFSDAEVGLPAQVLGALAGASIESILATHELSEGKITLKRWQTVMKWILGSLLYVALVVLAIGAVAMLAMMAIGLVLDVFGVGTFALILGLLFAFCIAAKLSSLAIDGICWVLDTLGEMYDKYIEPLTQKVKSWIARIRHWIKSVSGQVQNKMEEARENIQNATVSENEVNVQPVHAQVRS